MLDNLLDLVKKYTGDAVEKNPAIPNEKMKLLFNMPAVPLCKPCKAPLQVEK